MSIEEEVKRLKASTIPVNREDVKLANGSEVTPDHKEIDPETGLQKAYVVLSDTERAKGFVRRYRNAYRHLTCKTVTMMAHSIAETYARDPYFYSGTYCCGCRAHFPVGEDGEFTWIELDDSAGPKVGT